MTEIATIDWFGRWETSVFSENTAIFIFLAYPASLDLFHEPCVVQSWTALRKIGNYSKPVLVKLDGKCPKILDP